MSTMVFYDYLDAFLGHIDGMEVLDHTIKSQVILTSVDPEPGTVIVHGRVMENRDANGIRNERTRYQVYGHGYRTTKGIAEALHGGALGSGVLIPASDRSDQAFFDHVDSEQAPSLHESPGLTSMCFQFDLTAVSRSIS